MIFVPFIFARGGSVGLPNKNIKIFNGFPLIAWTINIAKKIDIFDKIYISTDSNEIAKVSERYGATIPFLRPAKLASNSSPELLSWKHAINYLHKNKISIDAIVSLPTTSPLRLTCDVIKCVELFKSGNYDLVVTATKARRDPSFNMLKKDRKDFFSLYNKDKTITRRQSSINCYDLSTICYVASVSYILETNYLFETDKIGLVEIPLERSIDIDTQLDFDIADFIYKKNRKIYESI